MREQLFESAPERVRAIETLDRLVTVLHGYSYRAGTERQLQTGIHRALIDAAIEHEVEKTLGADRLDFLASGVAIEVKIDGTFTAALAQCQRYAKHEEVWGILLATARPWSTRSFRFELLGKPCVVLRLRPRL